MQYKRSLRDQGEKTGKQELAPASLSVVDKKTQEINSQKATVSKVKRSEWEVSTRLCLGVTPFCLKAELAQVLHFA